MITRIIIADDHPAVRLGVRAILETQGRYRIVAEASHPEELLALLAQHPADMLLTDFAMPVGSVPDGHAMLATIRRRYPALPIALLTMFNNVPSLRVALQAGVRAIIDKSAPMDQIVQALCEVRAGSIYLSQSLRHAMADAMDPDAPDAVLSRKELEVLRLYVSGPTISEIAAQLGRTVSTISRQRIMAMDKLGIRTEAELFAYAYEQGLTPVARPSLLSAA